MVDLERWSVREVLLYTLLDIFLLNNKVTNNTHNNTDTNAEVIYSLAHKPQTSRLV